MAVAGTHWRPSAPVCVALAAAAHAAALLMLASPAQDASPGPDAARAAVRARYVEEPAIPRPGGAPESPAPEAAPTPVAEADAGEKRTRVPEPQSQADEAARDMSAAPAFEANGAPMLEHPDAPSPPDGVRLRVFVQVGPAGVATDLVAGTPPGEMEPAPAFQKAAKRALREAQFRAGSAPSYCFLVRFDPGAPTPQLAWLPGAGRDAARCLTGRQPPPREIEAATGP